MIFGGQSYYKDECKNEYNSGYKYRTGYDMFIQSLDMFNFFGLEYGI